LPQAVGVPSTGNTVIVQAAVATTTAKPDAAADERPNLPTMVGLGTACKAMNEDCPTHSP